MHGPMFIIELIAACGVGILAFVLLLSGASSRELGDAGKKRRRKQSQPTSTHTKRARWL